MKCPLCDQEVKENVENVTLRIGMIDKRIKRDLQLNPIRHPIIIKKSADKDRIGKEVK